MGKECIMIVEDDADINELLQKILRKEGFEVYSAYSGTGNSNHCADGKNVNRR